MSGLVCIYRGRVTNEPGIGFLHNENDDVFEHEKINEKMLNKIESQFLQCVGRWKAVSKRDFQMLYLLAHYNFNDGVLDKIMEMEYDEFYDFLFPFLISCQFGGNDEAF